MSEGKETNEAKWIEETPEDRGIDSSSLNTVDKRIWTNQERFLAAYTGTRTKTVAARAAGVHPDTVRLWEKSDKLDFKQRLEDADEFFCDGLEKFALDIVHQLGPRNSPLLLITLLNRHLPDKYRPNVVMPDSTPKDLFKVSKRDAEREHTEEASQTAVGLPDGHGDGLTPQRQRQRRDLAYPGGVVK